MMAAWVNGGVTVMVNGLDFNPQAKFWLANGLAISILR